MAFKFQLGSSTSDGAIVMAENGGDIDAGVSDIICRDAESLVTNSGPGTLVAVGVLSAKHNDGLKITGADGAEFLVKGARAAAEASVELSAVSTTHGRLIMRKNDGVTYAFGGAASGVAHFGNAPALATTSGAGFFGLTDNGSSYKVQMDGENGHVKLEVATISPPGAGSMMRITGNTVITGNLTCSESILIDSTHTVTADDIIAINDDATGALSSHGDTHGGFAIATVAKMILKKDDVYSGGVAVQMAKFDDSKFYNFKCNNMYGSAAGLHKRITNFPIEAKTATGNIVAADLGKLITVDTTSGAVVLTLPAISTIATGKYWRFKSINAANSLTIRTQAGETLDGTDYNGGSGLVFTDADIGFDIVSDGNNYFIM